MDHFALSANVQQNISPELASYVEKLFTPDGNSMLCMCNMTMVAKNANCTHCFKPFSSTFEQRKAFILERFDFEIEAKRAMTEATQNSAQPNEVPHGVQVANASVLPRHISRAICTLFENHIIPAYTAEPDHWQEVIADNEYGETPAETAELFNTLYISLTTPRDKSAFLDRIRRGANTDTEKIDMYKEILDEAQAAVDAEAEAQGLRGEREN